MRNSGLYLQSLVNDLVDFFNIKKGKFEINTDWTDLNAEISRFIETFEFGAEQKGIHVEFICE